MLYYKTKEEIELIRISSLLVGKTLAEVAKYIKPGVKTIDLDKIADQFIQDHGAKAAFKGYDGFPNALCISVNSAVVHGLPNAYELKDGDIISVDCGVVKNDFYGDSAYTFSVGNVSPEIQKLLDVTKESLYEGIRQAVAGKRVGDIGEAVQNHAERAGFSVVRELVGHGVGRSLHESPEVPNYGKRGKGTLLQSGLVIAIEPMINMGRKEVLRDKDGWTIKTADNKLSAHFEHTVAIQKEKADVLSTFEYIEEVLNKSK
ncbi:MAG TPA: type I methionyl aminopeptidase [Bacteroidia bacterium]|nr:type I methionyl aminopeptidase [Bacteroidia bacterium]